MTQREELPVSVEPDLRSALEAVKLEAKKATSSTYAVAVSACQRIADIASSALVASPKREEMKPTIDGMRDAALDLIRHKGWKPGDSMSAHSVAGLMAEFGMMVHSGEVQCGWPDCGCCADAACRDAVAAMEHATPPIPPAEERAAQAIYDLMP